MRSVLLIPHASTRDARLAEVVVGRVFDDVECDVDEFVAGFRRDDLSDFYRDIGTIEVVTHD